MQGVSGEDGDLFLDADDDEQAFVDEHDAPQPSSSVVDTAGLVKVETAADDDDDDEHTTDDDEFLDANDNLQFDVVA
jgi:hypothetical protein